MRWANAAVVTGWVVVIALWILAVTRWRHLTLEQLPAGSMVWFWLRVFGIPETDTNRQRFLICMSAIGMVMVTIAAFVLVFLS